VTRFFQTKLQTYDSSEFAELIKNRITDSIKSVKYTNYQQLSLYILEASGKNSSHPTPLFGLGHLQTLLSQQRNSISP